MYYKTLHVHVEWAVQDQWPVYVQLVKHSTLLGVIPVCITITLWQIFIYLVMCE